MLNPIPFFTPSTPFGPFQPLHEYVITNGEQLTWDNWYHLFVIPLVPLYVQALLLRYEGTRYYRIAVGVVGAVLIARAGCCYRLTQPWLNAINNGLGIGTMHLVARYLEFSFIEGPLLDRYFEAKGRHPLIAALDVAVNARWIGLGAIDLDQNGKVDSGHAHPQKNGHISPSKDDTDVIDGGIELSQRHQSIPNNVERVKEKWLPWPKVKRTRFQSVRRHLYIALRNYVIFDACLHLIRHYGPNTIGADHPVPNALYKFSHENQFIVFPILKGVIGEVVAPWWLVEVITEISVATGVWLGIAAGYHLLGGLLVASGLWETESWEVDIFDNPLASDSLLDFWGKRWHQFFRHHFILYSTLILRLLRIPINSGTILFTSFVLSGAMHSIGQFTMTPHPPLLPIFLIFPLSGLGCIAEVFFKRTTGRKVRGPWGKLWTWVMMLSIGRLGTVAWLESGVGGSYLTPPAAGRWVTDNLLDGILVEMKRK
ncbi:uncharacterized protein I303_102697 [Kwoniella dejecticola CBS 10117]|uniref:Wax synthase domain-containing protein n=1 Tax=Kwoniella dejecticola CBS 10117 TaxID=1296121 RepID=A0A1A6A9G3_9TREE|nr:uncharacterized protein I303_02712 [Kwoniella dejecticola CBS 10117]OBR86700.1 hypothetical protein I303_02712 [Kwoniella dejecticola CBS 10117]